MTSQIPDITLRPVSEDDLEFLLDAYAASREIELASVPWDGAMKRQFVEHQFSAQKTHYQEHYPEAVHSIIERGGEPVGRLYLNKTSSQISILDMVVLPSHRRQGIGDHLLTSLKTEADSTCIPIRVFVEEFNPSLQWFMKRDFFVKEENGFIRQLEYQKTESLS
jgi:GNAT superfamily N-acetyltransferase